MKIYIIGITPEQVTVLARAEGEHGMHGEMVAPVRPGESLFGLDVRELSKLGIGEHEVGSKD